MEKLKKFYFLSGKKKILLFTAYVCMSLGSILVYLISFNSLSRLLKRLPVRNSSFCSKNNLIWALNHVSERSRLSAETRCLPRTVGGFIFMSFWGQKTSFMIGVEKSDLSDENLLSHAWLADQSGSVLIDLDNVLKEFQPIFSIEQ